MSRFENEMITFEKESSFEQKENTLWIRGPKGALSFDIPRGVDVIAVTHEASHGVKVCRSKTHQKGKTHLVGLTYRMIKSMLEGVMKGFTKTLELNGVGYRWSISGEKLVMQLGYSHPVEYTIPSGVDLKVEQNKLHIMGINKQLVGQVSAKIRSIRSVEPYKGKGIRYLGETVILKQGKSGS